MYDELTEVDIKKMKEELDHRIRVLRPQLIEEVQTARAFGDLSENFEYKCAKQAKNRNDSRIRYLERMIRLVSLPGGRRVFCGIDEILKGTNTAERVAASIAILHFLQQLRQCLYRVCAYRGFQPCLRLWAQQCRNAPIPSGLQPPV